MFNTKLLITLALLLEANNTEQLFEIEVETYLHQDPITGQTLTCNRCPPGQHLQNHCTATHQTICAPCSENYYTQYWNYIEKCQYCNNFCKENQLVKKECSPFHNRVCECRKGYYWHFEFCIKHSECPPEYGVKVEGTPHKDTVCEKCPPGWFSSVSSKHEMCLKHTDCESLNLIQIISGTGWHDNLCSSCTDPKATGGRTSREEILALFFARQNMAHKQVIRFGRKLFGREAQKIFKKAGNISPQKLMILYIKEWKSGQNTDGNTSEEFLEKLREARLKKVAKRLEKKFHVTGHETMQQNLCNIFNHIHI
ncbi:tumor necrosis factor receptor superfamily member 6B-like [Huso huso]|uniref:Tumor necrosis factor receptor superfamily member 6B-like n=1 Tax=Huso huso TaxID=61971 RepID=A0ABR1A1A2_HUSHU